MLLIQGLHSETNCFMKKRFLSGLFRKIKVVLYQKKSIIGILKSTEFLQNRLSVEKGWSF